MTSCEAHEGARSSPPETEYLNASVLPEMLVEGKRRGDLTSIKNRERNRIAQAPVLVAVPSQNLLGALLVRRERPHDRQSAFEQPFARDRPAEFSQKERVCLRFDVIRDETGSLFGSDLVCHLDSPRVIGVVGVEEGEDGARIPEDAALHRSRIACLSRAPGLWPPLRPAPTSRNIG